MKPMARMALAALALGASAHADWQLSDYATVALDSADVKTHYGVWTYSNPSSRAVATVPVAGSLKIDASFGSDGTQGYSAQLGVLHPMRPEWAAVDVSTLSTIEFDIKTSVKPTDGWEIALGSQVYPPELLNAEIELQTPFQVPVANAWVHVVVFPEEFTYPTWFCDEITKPCPAVTVQDVLAELRNLRIAPRTKYSSSGSLSGAPCFACVGPTTPPISFELRNIVLTGVDAALPPADLSGCNESAPSLVVDPADADANNRLGVSWSAYSDTSLANYDPYDTRRGSSLAAVDFGTPGTALLTASLNKQVPGSWGYANADAGWGGLRAEIQGGRIQDLSGFRNIAFTVQASAWDMNTELVFKVLTHGIPDAQAHEVVLPLDYLMGEKVCVGLDDLHQPSNAYGQFDLEPSIIRGFAWETRIGSYSGRYTNSAFDQFRIGDISLWGVRAQGGKGKPAATNPTLRARYFKGRLRVDAPQGYAALDILTAQGRQAGSIVLDGKPARVELEPGLYSLVAHNGAGKSVKTKLLVLRQ